MSFQILPLDAAPFSHLFGASDAQLEAAGAIPYVADNKPGFPCRISLEDAQVGERCLLINHEHLVTASPYRSAHALFVRDGAKAADVAPDEVPDMIARRMLSMRAFDAGGMMLDAEVVDGKGAREVFERFLALEGADQLHIHSAARGCYLAKVIST